VKRFLLQRDKYRILLATLLAMIFIQPLVVEQVFAYWLFYIFLTLSLFASVYAVRGERRHLVIAMGLMVPIVILVWLDIPTKNDWYNIISNSSPILLFSYIAYLIFIDLVQARKIGVDMIAGGISIYLLISLTFAFLYIMIFNLNPDSFAISELLYTRKLGFEENVFIYFSIVTLTTLGYGDITPVSTLARITVQFEVLLAQLYLAIFIARLVSMHTASKMLDR